MPALCCFASALGPSGVIAVRVDGVKSGGWPCLYSVRPIATLSIPISSQTSKIYRFQTEAVQRASMAEGTQSLGKDEPKPQRLKFSTSGPS